MPEVTDGFVLTANSAVGGGMEWAAATGGSVDAEDVTVDSTTLVGVGTDAQAVFEELDNAIADHLADTVDAHDATAISFAPAGTIAATTVQAAIEEVAAEAGGSVEWEDVGTVGSGGGGRPPIVTALPGSPADLDEIYFAFGSGDDEKLWHLKYESSITDAYKWRVLGAVPLYAFVATSVNTNSTSFVDLGSGTPAVTLPLAGVYEVTLGCTARNNTLDAYALCTPVATGLAGADANGPTHKSPRADAEISVSGKIVASGISGTLKHQYRVTAGTGHFYNRWISAYPIRVG